MRALVLSEFTGARRRRRGRGAGSGRPAATMAARR